MEGTIALGVDYNNEERQHIGQGRNNKDWDKASQGISAVRVGEKKNIWVQVITRVNNRIWGRGKIIKACDRITHGRINKIWGKGEGIDTGLDISGRNNIIWNRQEAVYIV